MSIAEFIVKTFFRSQVDKLVRQQYSDLIAQTQALTQQVARATPIMAALKSTNDALRLDNSQKAQAVADRDVTIAERDVTIAQLQTQLAAAQASGTTPEELEALAQSSASIAQAVQALSDASAVNDPAN